jgi:spore maturation protein CgeB
MRLLVVHGGAVWATHDVYTGLLGGLRGGGHAVLEYALGARLDASHEWLQRLWQKQQRRGGPLADTEPSPADVQHHASEGVLVHALRHEPDWVLVVCGAYFHPDVAVCARRAGLRLAVVFTESPYDDAQQARVAPLYDVCFTNERRSVPFLREANPNTHYLPCAYDPAAHGPHLNGDAHPHDVVFVGTAFGARERLLSGVDWTGIDLGLYGIWGDLPDRHPLRPYVHDGLVNNQHAGALYRKAKIGLNLYRDPRGAPAESLNPRAYELAADGVFMLSQPRAEAAEKFGALDFTFQSASDLSSLLRHLLQVPGDLEHLGRRLPAAVAEDSYHHRAAQLVAHLCE